jgi:hypothetical protein
MKTLIKVLGQLLGIHFTPDNHVTPILRLGRYDRVKGPGFFWIFPLVERTLSPVKKSLHIGNFVFEEVLSKDNISFRVQMTVLFTFDPASTPKSVAAVLVRGDNHLLWTIVKEYSNQGLRRLASKFEAEELSRGFAMSTIERNLTRFLIAEMRILGITPLKNGGVLIKETIAPEKFKRAMLNAKRLEAILRSLAHFPAHPLIEQAIQAEFVTGLEHLEGNLTLLSTLSPLEAVHPRDILDAHRISTQNGRREHNGS